MDDYTLLHGDCLIEMAAMDAGSVDAVVTDPPYLLGFMGKEWDKPRAAQVWHNAWAAFAFRTLRPSCYMVAFGGTRTWHRLACAIEDAGFEIRDTLMWLYGSGFPKGKSCLKPAWEPIILARKPGPMRELGIEECRVGTVDNLNGGAYCGDKRQRDEYTSTDTTPGAVPMSRLSRGIGDYQPPAGRWPANLVLECTCDETREGTAKTGTHIGHNRDGTAVASRIAGLGRKDTRDIGYADPSGKEPVRIHTDPNCPCAMLDGQTGTLTSGDLRPTERPPDQRDAWRIGTRGNVGDSGGASRFFYNAKAPQAERWGYCQTCATAYSPKERTQHAEHETTMHPTQKPESLMRWLVRLVARPGDVVLDPFIGSGTTGVACAEEGREFVGIEREAEYVEISRRRIEAARQRVEAASSQGRLSV